ncbi:Hypothetical predicted protein [Xyrichtys novacula]|uniref:Uncharacterized protein n=1 Tax=Xyrichtys novacula TaxID=13765 RepID=A0AAV1H3X9_XYRNO|nr:Hypothetical predicted protein [Xyrichtys novacula]
MKADYKFCRPPRIPLEASERRHLSGTLTLAATVSVLGLNQPRGVRVTGRHLILDPVVCL